MGSQGYSRPSDETANSCGDQRLTDSSLPTLQPCSEEPENTGVTHDPSTEMGWTDVENYDDNRGPQC